MGHGAKRGKQGVGGKAGDRGTGRARLRDDEAYIAGDPGGESRMACWGLSLSQVEAFEVCDGGTGWSAEIVRVLIGQ